MPSGPTDSEYYTIVAHALRMALRGNRDYTEYEKATAIGSWPEGPGGLLGRLGAALDILCKDAAHGDYFKNVSLRLHADPMLAGRIVNGLALRRPGDAVSYLIKQFSTTIEV